MFLNVGQGFNVVSGIRWEPKSRALGYTSRATEAGVTSPVIRSRYRAAKITWTRDYVESPTERSSPDVSRFCMQISRSYPPNIFLRILRHAGSVNNFAVRDTGEKRRNTRPTLKVSGFAGDRSGRAGALRYENFNNRNVRENIPPSLYVRSKFAFNSGNSLRLSRHSEN